MIYKNIVCPLCGCLCDDIEVVTENGRVADVKNACAFSKSKFLNHAKDRAKPRIKKNGKLVEVPIEEALDEAAEVLKKADFPLIYGLSSTETDAQRLAVELAELIGASIDNTSSVCHGPTIQAAQDCGAAKCTLGEVKNRADLVIFWGCNPAEAHIKHATRYSITPRGLYTESGKKGREIMHMDVRETKTSKMANIFVKVEPGQDYELLSAFRAVLKGYDGGDVAGVPSETIKQLAEKMKSCKFGVIFFGLGLTMTGGKHMNINAALRLVRDLNDHTKFAIIPMRGHYNVSGANDVMTWCTGYPYAVNFSKGYPVYNPGEFSAVDILARGECDAALIIASDPVAHFPAQASKHLAKIPTIVIDPKISLTSLIAKIVIPSAIAGIECDGTAYRMDGIPLRLRKVIDSEFLPDREILKKIIEKVKA
ncbi:MAG: formylmethanofuran dehydrogenase subunit B [Hadesarchaea archaeon DG-33]|nr:MAG: formylmethanofuran dehydrogenase subunit B [Hadesarchaea archaeon DG-33]